MTATTSRSAGYGWRFLLPVSLGSMLNPVNSSMLATALIPIGRDLHVSPARTALLVASLYVACAVAQPTLGRVGEVFGPRRGFLAGTALVGVGSILGTVAGELWHLVIARVIIGVGTSAAFPNAVLMIRRREIDDPSLDPGPALGALTLAGQVTAAVGLPLGGLLVQAFSWRATFAFNLPVVLLCLVATWRWIEPDQALVERSTKDIVQRLDPLGVALFAVAVSGLLVTLQASADIAWPSAACAVVAFALLLAWSRRARFPFIDVRALVENRALARTYVRTALFYVTTYTMMYGFTQWLQDGRGLTASSAGLAMLPMTAVAVPLAYAVSRARLVRLALLISAGACAITSAYLVLIGGSTPIVTILVVPLGFGVVLGMMSAGNQNALYTFAHDDGVATAAGLYRTCIYLGAIGSSALTGEVFAGGVDDSALSTVGAFLTGAGILLVLMVLTDRALPRTIRSPLPPPMEDPA